METQIEQVLKEVNHLVLLKKNEDKERFRRGEQFNIFKICGIDHYELQHSSIISALLDPHGSHGQGELYLKLFMQAYGSKLPIDEIEYDKVFVRKEEWTEAYDGRMDIYVEYKDLPLIIIENKLYAKDQSIQLKKYKEDADQKVKTSHNKNHKYEIVYLTLDGKNASGDSGDGVDYMRVSYASHIIKWLDACIENSISIPIVKETLLQYQNHLKQLTNQTMQIDDKKQIFDILTKYPDAYEMIENAFNSVVDVEFRKYVFEKYVKDKLQKMISSIGLEIDFDNFPDEEGFYVDKAEWKNKGIRLFFGKLGRYQRTWVGISSDSDQVTPQKALNCLIGDNPNKWWPYGTQYLPDGLDHWDWPVFIKEMINGSFVEYVVSKVKEVNEELDDKTLSVI